MVKWRCTACGKVHRSNPTKCKKCGHSVLQQNRLDENGGHPKRQGVTTQTKSVKIEKTWYCDRCKQTHDYEPEKCKVCRRTEFTLIEKEREVKVPRKSETTLADNSIQSTGTVTTSTADPDRSSGIISGKAVILFVFCLLITWLAVIYIL